MIRSVISYAAAGWAPWASASGLDRLARADHRALRLISGLLSTAPLESLHVEAGVTPLQSHFEFLTGKSWLTAHCLPQSHPRAFALNASTVHRTCRDSWREAGQRICSFHGAGPITDTQLSAVGTPPWQLTATSNIQFCWDISKQSKGTSQRKSNFLLRFQRFDDTILI